MNRLRVIRVLMSVIVAVFVPIVASADCTWTSPTGTSIMYTTSPCTNVGVNQTSALWPLDVNGTIGVKGSPALIRPTSWADVDGLKFMGTQLALGQLNSRAYNYTGSAIAFIGGFYDGSELLRLASSSNNGLISVTQSSVDSLNADFKNTLLHVVKSSPGSLGPEIKLENTGNAVNDAEAVTFADNGFNRAQIRSTVENDPPNYRGTIEFHTGLGSLTEKMRITGDGRVGIGTGAPQFPLDVNGYMGTSVMPLDDTTQALSGLHFSNRGSGGGTYRWSFLMASPGGASGISPSGLELYEYPNTGHPACCIARLVIRKASSATVTPAPFVIDGLGHVGIGVWSPDSYALDVSGTLHVSGNALFGGTVTGANIQANYQDVAEWVPASEAMTAGTVVVIDPAARNGVKPSSRSYDTSVAGVVSAQPGVLLGQAGNSKEKIATTGRVKVRVDASRGSIAAGDLLVTSDKPGIAMRSEPVDVNGIKMHRPGTLVGKALEPLKDGTGEILVLLSLQ
jgi:hypothetical protein